MESSNGDRVCRTCKEQKPIDEFRLTGGYRTRQCRRCDSQQTSAYQKQPDRRERTLEIKRQSNMRRKQEAVSHYGGKCACCGEAAIEFLSIDHLNRDGSNHRKAIGTRSSGSRFYRWLRDNNWPDGFQVLCFNCNFASYWWTCPHKKVSAE